MWQCAENSLCMLVQTDPKDHATREETPGRVWALGFLSAGSYPQEETVAAPAAAPAVAMEAPEAPEARRNGRCFGYTWLFTMAGGCGRASAANGVFSQVMLFYRQLTSSTGNDGLWAWLFTVNLWASTSLAISRSVSIARAICWSGIETKRTVPRGARVNLVSTKTSCMV